MFFRLPFNIMVLHIKVPCMAFKLKDHRKHFITPRLTLAVTVGWVSHPFLEFLGLSLHPQPAEPGTKPHATAAWHSHCATGWNQDIAEWSEYVNSLRTHYMYYRYWKKITRGPWTLVFCLTTAIHIYNVSIKLVIWHKCSWDQVWIETSVLNDPQITLTTRTCRRWQCSSDNYMNNKFWTHSLIQPFGFIRAPDA